MTRNEVIKLYQFFKRINLKGATTNLAKAIIRNQILLKPAYEKITSDIKEIEDKYLIQDLIDLYVKVNTYDNKASNEYKELVEEFRKQDAETALLINQAVEVLDNDYSFDFVKISFDELIEHLHNIQFDYSANDMIFLESILLYDA